MACEACGLKIRKKTMIYNASSHCGVCGYVEYGLTYLGIYVGMKDYFHYFNFDRPHYCPNCGTRGLSFYFPCSDANYFDMSSINISTENEDYE